MSPTTTGICCSSTLRRSWATIGSDSSMPVTGTPRAASGTPTRPVPMASSRAGPPSASRPSRSSVGSRTSGANSAAESASYLEAISSVHTSLLVTCAAFHDVPPRGHPNTRANLGRCPTPLSPCIRCCRAAGARCASTTRTRWTATRSPSCWRPPGGPHRRATASRGRSLWGDAVHQRLASHLAPSSRRWAPTAALLVANLSHRLVESTDWEFSEFALYDLGQAVAHLTLQAQAMGLAVRQFRAFDREGVAEEFGVPPHWEVSCMAAVGRPAPDDVPPPSDAPSRRRRSLEEILWVPLVETG